MDERAFAGAVAADLAQSRQRLVDAWLDAPGHERRLRPQDPYPGEQLRSTLPATIDWLAAEVDGDAPVPLDVDAFKSIARLHRTGRYTISEVLDEFDRFDAAVFARLDGLARSRFPALPPADALAVAERLRCALQRMRTVIVGTYEEDAEAHAAELSGRLDAFVRTLSHELKNPLGAALSAAELLGDPHIRGDDAKFEQFAALTRRNLGRIQALLEDLRALALKDAPSSAVPRLPLATVIENVLSEVHTAAAEKGVRIHADLAALPDREVDAARMTLVLMNLVWNAVNYADPAKPDRWVRIECAPQDGAGLRLAVADNGLGIPGEARERIFERFFRAHPQVQGGTGLGLAIVAEALGQIRGTVTVESEASRGTTFVVVVPAAEEAGAPGTAGSPS